MDRVDSESTTVLLNATTTPPVLLTLPRSDLATDPITHTSTGSSLKSGSGRPGDLLLVQLPEDWTVHDLQGSHFVARTDQPLVTLVCNDSADPSRRASFTVTRAETSNCFVLMMIPPPSLPMSSLAAVSSSSEQASCTPPSSKRARCDETTRSNATRTTEIMDAIPTRLVKVGGSGSCFLELHRKHLKLADLRRVLLNTAEAVLDPYESSLSDDSPSLLRRRGVALQRFAQELQFGTEEIRRGLYRMMDVYEITTDHFVILAEELQLTIYHALVATLAEDELCQDYAGVGVPLDHLVHSTFERLSPEERFSGVKGVIRHAVWQMIGKESLNSADDGYNQSTATNTHNAEPVRLQVSNVAKCVARRLFCSQRSPWKESLLLPRWQSYVPGVGTAYQVSTSMLRGLAVRITPHGGHDDDDDDKTTVLWKYLPHECLWTDHIDVAFATLFDCKGRWQLEELEPYLDTLQDATGLSRTDLLLQYTKTIEMEECGRSVKYYQQR